MGWAKLDQEGLSQFFRYNLKKNNYLGQNKKISFFFNLNLQISLSFKAFEWLKIIKKNQSLI